MFLADIGDDYHDLKNSGNKRLNRSLLWKKLKTKSPTGVTYPDMLMNMFALVV